jgi:uncharacterized protein (TIGR04222 family)
MTSGDTWGIPGPTFLIIFGVVAAGLLLVNAYFRLVVLAGPATTRPGELTGTEAGYLTGGAQRAVGAALGALRTAGAIEIARDGSLAAGGPPPAGADDLTTAVHHAAYRHRRVRDLTHDPRITQSLERLRSRLTEDDLLVSQHRRATARWLGATLLALAGIGVLRMIAGMTNGRPVGYLMLSLALAVPIGLFLTVQVPWLTGAGRRAIADLRRRHGYLAPSSRPAYGTYGMTGAAMGVALFGSAALLTIDPEFAQAAELHRTASAGSSGAGASDSGDGGGGCGGCGGCGG